MIVGSEVPRGLSWSGRILAILGVLPFVALLAVPVIGYLVVRNTFGEVGTQRANAEAATEQVALSYADAVVGTGDDSPSDDQLDQLGSDSQVAVHAVDREATHADLVLVLAVREAYSGLFAGYREVEVCYEVAFIALGSHDATYTLVRRNMCPP